MGINKSGWQAVGAAHHPKSAHLDSKPVPLTPSIAAAQSRYLRTNMAMQGRIDATQYAATVIAARCCLSPAVALRVVELIGLGGAA
jgi:hypothetical protein